MRTKHRTDEPAPAAVAAFSLVEALVAMAVVGILFMALYSGLAYGFTRIQYSRESLRATQILMEKMETIRLYNWSQINDPKYVPKTFTATYNPSGSGKGKNPGVVYSGSLAVEEPGLNTNYKDNMRRVTVTLSWKTGPVPRSRALSTFVAQNGLYNYIYQQRYH